MKIMNENTTLKKNRYYQIYLSRIQCSAHVLYCFGETDNFWLDFRGGIVQGKSAGTDMARIVKLQKFVVFYNCIEAIKH